MKRILITGANSYIGTSFENYIYENYPDEYVIDTVDMIGDSWREYNFSGYDSVFHVAGIVHQNEKKINPDLYWNVNCKLAFETAVKAKNEGVKQFVFLSSMSVYGMDRGIIDFDTQPQPKSQYAKSKYEAEKEISKLSDSEFIVCIIRPPMVYGKGCKGNFQTILNIVRKSYVFPMIYNKRSMIYIDNLSIFLERIFSRRLDGVFLPQNREYVQTSTLAKFISLRLHKKLFLSRLLGFFVLLSIPMFNITRKAFGSLVYVKSIDDDLTYDFVDFETSIYNSI